MGYVILGLQIGGMLMLFLIVMMAANLIGQVAQKYREQLTPAARRIMIFAPMVITFVSAGPSINSTLDVWILVINMVGYLIGMSTGAGGIKLYQPITISEIDI